MSKSPHNPYQKKRASDKEKHEKVEKFRLEEKIFEEKMVEFLEKVEMETENKLENEMIILLEKVEREKKLFQENVQFTYFILYLTPAALITLRKKGN